MDTTNRFQKTEIRAMSVAKVSAIIPTYNSAPYVCDAVDSLLAQTYPLDQIIVVDDGSVDDTAERLRRYGDKITYIWQANAGPPAARNRGFRHVTGDFVALLDADDLWVPDKLARQLDYFKRRPQCGLVYSDMKTFDENGIIEHSVKISRNLQLPSGYIFPQMFDETLFQTSAVIMRKACVELVGDFDVSLRMGDDYEYFLRVTRHYEAGYVDEPLVLYRQHPDQGTRTWGKRLHEGFPWEFLVLRRILHRYPEVINELGRSRVQLRLAKTYFALAYACMLAKDHASARKLLLQAIQQYPYSVGFLRYYLMTFVSPELLAKLKTLGDGIRRGDAEMPAGLS